MFAENIFLHLLQNFIFVKNYICYLIYRRPLKKKIKYQIKNIKNHKLSTLALKLFAKNLFILRFTKLNCPLFHCIKLVDVTHKRRLVAAFRRENEKSTTVDKSQSRFIFHHISLLKSRRLSQLIDGSDMHIHNMVVTFDLARDGQAIIRY